MSDHAGRFLLLRQRKLRRLCPLRAECPAAYLAAMTLHMRSYLTLFLVLAVTLTAHSAGAMRGMRDATGQIVICSGAGPVVIYVDADGQPARAPGNCPDCITLSMEALVAPELVQLYMRRPQGRAQRPAQVRIQSRMTFQACARSPPFVC
jgi:hypothetical protein